MNLYPTHADTILAKPYTSKCIVLDLDETLVHSNENIGELEKLDLFRDPILTSLCDRIYCLDVDGSTIWGITRPGLQGFLLSCFNYFDIVAVWSAGSPTYVDKICEYIFRDFYPITPSIIANRSFCRNYNGTLDKPLEDMFAYLPQMNLKNTFILDDRLTTFKFCNPKNGILIPPYRPESTIESLMSPDERLYEVMEWLCLPQVVHSKDVRTLNKENIFGDTPMEIY